MQRPGVWIQFPGRAIANDDHFASYRVRLALTGAAALGRVLLGFHRLIEAQAEGALEPLQFGGGSGSQIDAHARRFGDGVDGSSAANDSNVECALGRRRHGSLTETLDCAGQDHNGIRRAEIAPRMPAGTAHDNFETSTAQRLSHDRVRAGPIQNQAVGDGVLPAWRRENVSHSAQVAFALFPNIADKDERHGVPHTHRAEQRRDTEHGRHAGAIVGNARPIESSSLLANVQRRSGGKHRIDVCAERNVALAETGMDPEDVSHVIDADVIQGEFTKTFGEPGPTSSLAKWRGRDPRHLELPVSQLRLLRAKPVKRRTDFRRSCEAGHFLLKRVRHFGARAAGHELVSSSYNGQRTDWIAFTVEGITVGARHLYPGGLVTRARCRHAFENLSIGQRMIRLLGTSEDAIDKLVGCGNSAMLQPVNHV
jgi:hypothetical protein